MRGILVVIASAGLLFGCGTPSNIRPVSVPTQVIFHPPLNVDAETEIGQTIISKSNLSVFPAVTVVNESTELLKQNPLSNRWSGTVVVRPGTFKKSSEDPQGSFYPDPSGTYESTVGVMKCTCGVFVPNDPTKSPVLFMYHTQVGAAGIELGTTPVALAKTTIESWSTDSFKRELIYGGLSQKTISISYREFTDKTARPAFTQDLKYDLTEGDMIGFRGARFQVIKASNTSIKYKVLKPLD